jgi:hypothetical protein
MLYTVSADALRVFRLMLDTSAHEGVERGRAAVQGGHGGPQRRADGDGGGAGLGSEPANDACVAGSLRAAGNGGDGRPLSPSDPKAGDTQVRESERNGDYWVSRKVTSNGIVCVGYQKVNVGQRNAGSAFDILVKDGLLQFWVGSQLVKTEVRATKGVARKKNAEGQAPRR